MGNPAFWYFWIGIIALVIGSFLNVVIYRLPLILKNNFTIEYNGFLGKQIEQNNKKITLSYPRSFCPTCENTIVFWQNIPLLSYLFLKGKCYYCKEKISYKYPLVEFSSVLLSLIAVLHFGLTIKLCLALIFIWLVIALFFIDLYEFLLPDSLTLSLLWIGLLANLGTNFQTLDNAVISTVIAYCSLLAVAYLYKFFTNKDGMGHGDIKLFAAFGAWFGWENLPMLLLVSSLSGTIIGLSYLIKNKYSKNTPIPFGPFLILGATIVLFVKF